MADSKKYDGSQWEHSLRKQTTASEIIVPPTTIYTDGSNINAYTIKGNTVHNGTPTPSDPVDVVGVGTLDSGQYKIPILINLHTMNVYLGDVQSTRHIKKFVLTGQENITLNTIATGNLFRIELPALRIQGQFALTGLCSHYRPVILASDRVDGTISGGDALIVQGVVDIVDDYATVEDFKAYLAQQYANSTPVTIWYVLAASETATVNEPLMKIGTYADSISNVTAIPTTQGANSITVDTTVQPSEFSATWTGWHDSSVKEYNGTDWQ